MIGGVVKRSRNISGVNSSENFDEISIKRVRLGAPNTTTSRSITFPDNDGTVALISDIPGGGGNLMTTDTVQSVTARKTFDSAPVISSIRTPTGFNLTVPATQNGVLALTSDISNVVTTNTDQTITGTKTFSSAPSITAIINGAVTITLQAVTGTLALLSDLANYVTLSTNQTISGLKEFSNYVRITNQYGLYQTSITGCTLYSNTYTPGQGGVQVDTTNQGDGFSILTLPNMASNAVTTLPNVSGTLLSTGAGFTIPNGDVTLSTGRFIATTGGSIGAPTYSINGSNTGLYSSAVGTVSITTNGVQRATFDTGRLLLSNNINIQGQGACIIQAGTGGHTGNGPFSSTLAAQSATNVSVRPSGQSTTGIWGNGNTSVNTAVQGNNIVTCTSSGAQLSGTLSVSGVSTLTGGRKIGANGTTVLLEQSGTVTTAIPVGGSFGTQSVVLLFGQTFSGTPNVTACVTNAISGVNNINAVICTVGNVTSTGCTIYFCNPFSSPTTTTVTGSWKAWL